MLSALRFPKPWAYWLCFAVLVAGLRHQAFAQNSTPARQLGQSSPGFIPSFSLESEKLRRAQQNLPTFITDQPGVTPAGGAPTRQYDGPVPWWEGVETVTLESMKPQRYFLGISALAGWEYDDNPFLLESDTNPSLEGPTTKEGVNSYFARLPVTFTYEGGRGSVLANYNPEFRTYDGQDIEEAFNHSAGLFATYTDGKLTLSLSANFAQTDGSNVEAGERVDATVLASTFTATYQVSPKTSLGGSIGHTQDLYDDGLNSNRGYTLNGFFDYEMTPKTQVGLGVGYNMFDVDLGSNSDALNLTARVNWRATEKFSLRAVIGGEWRQYDDATITTPVTTTAVAADGTQTTTTTFDESSASGNDTVSPIFNIGALYALSDTSSISLDAYRRMGPAISEVNQGYYATGVMLSASQVIYDRFTVSLNTGFENSEYESAVEGVVTNRTDDYWYAGITLSCRIREKVAIELYYRYSDNESTGINGVPFQRNLFGASLSYSF